MTAMDGADLMLQQRDLLMAWLARRQHDFERLLQRMDRLQWNRGDEAYRQCKAAIAAIDAIKSGIEDARKRREGQSGDVDRIP